MILRLTSKNPELKGRVKTDWKSLFSVSTLIFNVNLSYPTTFPLLSGHEKR